MMWNDTFRIIGKGIVYLLIFSIIIFGGIYFDHLANGEIKELIWMIVGGLMYQLNLIFWGMK